MKKTLPQYVISAIVIVFIVLQTATLSAQEFVQSQVEVGLGILQNNNGVAVADYDGDLDLDIFVVALAQDISNDERTKSRLFRNNNNGTFTDVTDESGLTNLLPFDPSLNNFFGLKGFKHGASWGDFNNDGFPDLLFTHSEKLQLFVNNNGVFTDISETSGLEISSECRHTGATWFDYNNDGFLDLYISEWNDCGTNSLYLNNGGDGTFSNVTALTNLQDSDGLASYTSVPIDINEDGWMDLYVSNDFNDANSLFINQTGTTFEDQAQQYGLDNMIDDMGITFGDFNLDGSFDVFLTGIDENRLLVNDGTNNFSDETIANNLGATGWAWGTRFADFDLDGDEDLIVVNGYEFENRSTEPNVYYRNLTADGQSGFEDASEALNFNDLTVSVEAVDFDYDNDGDLDIYVTNADQPSILYENKLLNFDEENSSHFFKVLLQGTISNRDAIGTTLTVTTNSGTYKRYYTGVGFLSQSLQAVHFGLDQDMEVLELEIKWPSGLIENYQNFDTDSTVRAIEGQGIEVLDIIPSQKIYGCLDPFSCTYNPEATIDDGSCTYLDANQITGGTSSGYFRVESYSYPIQEGSSADWTVIGGEIIEGEGTSTVLVRWDLNETGSLAVRENDGVCFSEEQTLDVALSASELPENVTIARLWNEVLLEAIRNDFARPTVHARNLFHTSVAMYDIWAIYDEVARPYMIGNNLNGFSTELEDFIPLESIEDSRDKAISYAMYRILSHRFQNSPNAAKSQELFDLVMEQLGYDTNASSTLYQFGNAANLGNYVAEVVINYGLIDGSREQQEYTNAYYEPVNPPLAPAVPTTTPMNDPNRWQALSLDTFIDQSGNVIPGSSIDFLSPEWGNVLPFAMTSEDYVSYQRDEGTYRVYNDPGAPPYLNVSDNDVSSDAYKLGFSMVSYWGAHLDPSDGVLWDISPGALGNTNIDDFPTAYEDYPSFYNVIDGGDIGQGHSVNPVTGEAYEPQIVPRGDYARVLAEFWADGPDSETPPGHWFTILNVVNEHPQLEKRFEGEGELLDDLEWDVKCYFILGGAMHDSAISAWSVKGWYDYLRPISAIRHMAVLGQSSDTSLDNYHIAGIPLLEGYVEIVGPTDPLRGDNNEHVGKIKLYSWRGPDYIEDETVDVAGVGWILAENWWPYQRPTFVTPPFAGFVSGHSTYSRAASEVLTRITGSPFFPGGLGEFVAKQNDFLVFEQGPSVDVKLQWATYRDASDQTSLSRIWGGIHPPADDIPGRLIGETVGNEAFDFAVPYFTGAISSEEFEEQIVYPNPVSSNEVFVTNSSETDEISIFDIRGRQVNILSKSFNQFGRKTKITIPEGTATGLYFININNESKLLVIQN